MFTDTCIHTYTHAEGVERERERHTHTERQTESARKKEAIRSWLGSLEYSSHRAPATSQNLMGVVRELYARLTNFKVPSCDGLRFLAAHHSKNRWDTRHWTFTRGAGVHLTAVVNGIEVPMQKGDAVVSLSTSSLRALCMAEGPNMLNQPLLEPLAGLGKMIKQVWELQQEISEFSLLFLAL